MNFDICKKCDKLLIVKRNYDEYCIGCNYYFLLQDNKIDKNQFNDIKQNADIVDKEEITGFLGYSSGEIIKFKKDEFSKKYIEKMKVDVCKYKLEQTMCEWNNK